MSYASLHEGQRGARRREYPQPRLRTSRTCSMWTLPEGSHVVPFRVSYRGFYYSAPKRYHMGAFRSHPPSAFAKRHASQRPWRPQAPMTSLKRPQLMAKAVCFVQEDVTGVLYNLRRRDCMSSNVSKLVTSHQTTRKGRKVCRTRQQKAWSLQTPCLMKPLLGLGFRAGLGF